VISYRNLEGLGCLQYGSDYLTFLLPHCGPCDNFCYLGHIKKLVDDDDDDRTTSPTR